MISIIIKLIRLMKRILLPLVLGGFIITSCSRDNDNPITELETPILPTKISWEMPEEKYKSEITFTYDMDKIKESKLITYNKDRIIDNETLKYHYTGDKITSIERYSNPLNIGEYKQTYNFEYNADGSLKRSPSSTYTIKNGNLISFKDHNNVTTHTFDDKNSPFKNVKGLLEIGPELYTTFTTASFEHSFPYYKAFNNNILTFVEVDTNGGKTEQTFTYQYNSKGYPIKAIENHVNSQSTVNFVKTFTYNK